MKEKQTRRKKRHSLTLGESKRLGACTERLSQSVSQSVSHFPFCRETETVPAAPKRQCRGGGVAADLAHGGGGGRDAEDRVAAAAENAADARPGSR